MNQTRLTETNQHIESNEAPIQLFNKRNKAVQSIDKVVKREDPTKNIQKKILGVIYMYICIFYIHILFCQEMKVNIILENHQRESIFLELDHCGSWKSNKHHNCP